MTLRLTTTLCASLLAAAAFAADPLPLFDLAALDPATGTTSNGARAERATADGQPALKIVATPEDGKWPGVILKAPAGKWDLSAYDAVEMDLRNPGTEIVRFGVRVDNPDADGNKGCNTENSSLRPGQSRTVRVTFGKSWGGPGFALDRATVVALLVFFDQPKGPVELLVTGARAMPPLAVAKEQGGPGPLIDFGPAFHAPTQLGENGATGKLVDLEGGRRALRVEADASSGQWPGMALLPVGGGKWNLNGCKAVDFDLENPGDKPLGVGLRVDNPGADGRRNCNAENARLAPRERKTFRVTFGTSYEGPAFILDTANVTACLVFFGNPKELVALLVHGVTAIEGQAPKPFVLQAPREKVALGFEPDEAATDFVLRGGVLTNDAATVIAGTRSLTGDTRGKEVQWFEFASTAAGLLAPGYTYHYSFQYRILHAEAGAKAYSLFRSHGKGWGKTDRNWKDLPDPVANVGKTLTCEGDVSLGIFNDYMLLFGLNGPVAIAIDELRITRGAPYVDTSLQDELKQAVPAGAERVLTYDFEQDAATFVVAGEPAYATGADAVSGARSLLLDTKGRSSEWNELAFFADGKLEPGYRYVVTAVARMIEKAPNANLYFLARSKSKGHLGPDKSWRDLRYAVGELAVFTATVDVQPGELEDYRLTFGLHRQARMALDDVAVYRLPLPESRIKERVPLDVAKAKLVFEDTFDGDKVDASKWAVIGDFKRHYGYWRKANSALTGDGRLALRFDKEDGVYTSGCIETKGKFEFLYGYVEVRMMNPTQEGHWPGIWLFGDKIGNVGDEGRDGTEVDIVETPWRKEDKISNALHWDGYGDHHKSVGNVKTVPGINAGWHTYALDWSPDGYIFFVDGVETWRSDAGGVCRNPLFVMLSDECVKGGWCGDPDKATALPDFTYFDYVRVWQAK